MTISDITATHAAGPARPADKTLKTACHEFEGMLLGNILKQSIVQKPDEDDEDSGGNNSALMAEYAAEQTGRALSSNDVTGIAALLQRQMRNPGA